MSLPAHFKETYGPWAIVTGASSGIGEQFAHLLTQQGLNVILVARRTDRITTLAEQLSAKHNVEVIPLTLDLADANFITPLSACCKDKDIGLIISNAGSGAKGLHHETSLNKLNLMLDLNCRAPMLLSHAFAPALIARGKGGIIITASIEAYLGFPYSSAYSATKAFAKTLGEGIWGELKQHNIDVLVLNPGSTDTETLGLQGINADDMVGLMSPTTVANYALEKLGKTPVVISGVMNKIFIKLLCMLPRSIAVTAAGAGLKSAIDKSKTTLGNT